MGEKDLYNFELEELEEDWARDFKKIRDKVKLNEAYAKFVAVICKKLIKNEEDYLDIKTINSYVRKTPDYINKISEIFISLNMLVKTQKGRKNYYVVNFALKGDWEDLLKIALTTLNLVKEEKNDK